MKRIGVSLNFSAMSNIMSLYFKINQLLVQYI